ncbi:hypothetical protein ISW95_002982 [Salmonella enterica]|nr:hypothetical protein [Salmonella enterica]ECC5777758.1 hypothetical protein [Salmonella enterica]ECF8085399.1 hypothetical protein [Salmonella enterica]ECG7521168.1 hypothetical protein [Salmonella enterica]ECK6604362.1 hypothetical protein [Salmonella enterica]
MESMAEGMIKDLVASGHALADDMTGAPSVLVRCLAAQLEVQLVRANALAAENAVKQEFIKNCFRVAADGASMDGADILDLGERLSLFRRETYQPVLHGYICGREAGEGAVCVMRAPATDAFLAEMRAQGVEMFSEKFGGGTQLSDMVKEVAKDFAAQLRKGAVL